MFKTCVFLAFCLAVCCDRALGKAYCGYIPTNLFVCLPFPPLFKDNVVNACNSPKIGDDCNRYSCLFREAKLVKDGAIDKTKLGTYLNHYGEEHPEWVDVVQKMKTDCLEPASLPSQGIYVNCPAYDFTYCAFISYIKYATPSQWKTDSSCNATRAWATDCPVCPNDCFNAQIPIGSCNACLWRPPTS